MANESINATLDANVLYPAPLRDLLLTIANKNIFNPFWSDKIQSEWKLNLLKNRKDLKPIQLDRTIKLMNKAFPEANVSEYHKIKIKGELPDTGDIHVLQTAIKSNSKFIITSNKKDFPVNITRKHDVFAIKPDDFIYALVKSNSVEINDSISEILKNLKNPPVSKDKFLKILSKLKLSKTVRLLKTNDPKR